MVTRSACGPLTKWHRFCQRDSFWCSKINAIWLDVQRYSCYVVHEILIFDRTFVSNREETDVKIDQFQGLEGWWKHIWDLRNFLKGVMIKKTRWSPRTRMPTRMLRNTDLILICHISSKLTCETPWVHTLRWHSCRTPCLTLLRNALVRHSCLTLLWDTLVRHSYLTLLEDTLTWHSCQTLLPDTSYLTLL